MIYTYISNVYYEKLTFYIDEALILEIFISLSRLPTNYSFVFKYFLVIYDDDTASLTGSRLSTEGID